MSRLSDLTQQLTASLEAIGQRIQDTELYQRLAERYNALSPQGQQVTNVIVVILVIGAAVFFPGSTLLDSKTQMAAFESQRNLVKELFKTYREATSQSGLPVPPPSDMMINQITSQLKAAQLLPEQILSVTVGEIEGNLIPSGLVRDVIVVNLAKLNLRQILDIGNNLNRISQTAKVKDLSIQASANMAGYFDTTFKVYALNIPEPMETAPLEPESTDTRPKKNRDTGGDDE